MSFEPKGEFFIPFVENVVYTIDCVVDDFEFFPLKGSERNSAFYEACNTFSESAESARKASPETFCLRQWFVQHRAECTVGVNVQRYFQCSTGNKLKVLDLVLPVTAYRVEFEEDGKTERLIGEQWKQENALTKALSSGEPSEVLTSFVGGTFSFKSSKDWYKFRKKDNTFSAQFKLRKWEITAPTATK